MARSKALATFSIILSALLILLCEVGEYAYRGPVAFWLLLTLWLCRKQIRSSVLWQALCLTVIGVLSLLSANELNFENLATGLTQYMAIIALIICVQPLTLLNDLPGSTGLQLRFNRNYSSLFIMAHLFSSCMNLASLRILGDKFFNPNGGNEKAASFLLVGFATCSCWSPFFAALTLCIAAAPNSTYASVVPFGFLFSAIFMTSIYYFGTRSIRSETARLEKIDFSLKFILKLLSVIAMTVGIVYLDFGFSVIVAVSISCLTVVLITLVLNCKTEKLTESLLSFLQNDLGRAVNEIALFSSCGVLSLGISTLVGGVDPTIIHLLGTPLVTTLIPLIIVGLAMIGLHPVASIASVGAVFSRLYSDSPDLLAIMLVIGWCLAVITSPMSGARLYLSSSFQISQLQLTKSQKHIYGPAIASVLVVYLSYLAFQTALH